jgi:hypothetical protein
MGKTEITTTQEEQENSDDSIELYYKAFNSYRRDSDESNSEATERHLMIEEKFQQLKKNKRQKHNGITINNDHMSKLQQTTSTQYKGELTAMERHEIALKVQDSLNKEDYDNMPIEYLIEGGDIFPEAWKRNFPLNKPKEPEGPKHNDKRLYAKVIEQLKQYQTLPSPEQFTPLPLTWEEFQVDSDKYLTHPLWDQCSPQEYYQWTTYDERKEETRRYEKIYGKKDPMTLSNNVQHVNFKTENPEKLQNPYHPTHPIEIIFDTGAAISMLPGDFPQAWTNLRPCLHKIQGCFSGVEHTDNYIGEFHAILTLDNEETIGLRRSVLVEGLQTRRY